MTASSPMRGLHLNDAGGSCEGRGDSRRTGRPQTRCRKGASPARRPGMSSATLTITFLLAAAQSAVAGTWQHDFEAAERQARQEQRPLLLHFGATWCGPCRRMEAQTLNQPQTAQLLDTAIGVHIDVDRRRDLRGRFRVTSFPTDVLISHDGRELYRRAGFASVGQYTAELTGRILAAAPPRRLPGDRDAIATLESRGVQQPERPVTSGGVSADPQRNGGLVNSNDPARSSSEPTARSRKAPMLEGYSVVALAERREWVKGSAAYQFELRGQVYWFADEAERQQFLERPRRYTPRLLGCDPVLFQQQDRATLGNIKFAAFYRDDVFLFVSEENRLLFHADPENYQHTRLVTVDEIETIVR